MYIRRTFLLQLLFLVLDTVFSLLLSRSLILHLFGLEHFLKLCVLSGVHTNDRERWELLSVLLLVCFVSLVFIHCV
ncbi:hypothetical protein K450DRAFT_220220 [Umbelopsis ramanniana AG]|uniref:Uncharacterized protein n=1 Tax=Umbelopsis ramanniana AG TaxID=1314678 RepID=A0AAD5EHL8_UMBRA|nr:uncharacterized protein K450DRAFT_220220 [Umbelopsis ramanniana AG]KAI8583838.1 hypothetical protein K450DRAFT_220220 [Umbelopsis ramanniana AG]